MKGLGGFVIGLVVGGAGGSVATYFIMKKKNTQKVEEVSTLYNQELDRITQEKIELRKILAEKEKPEVETKPSERPKKKAKVEATVVEEDPNFKPDQHPSLAGLDIKDSDDFPSYEDMIVRPGDPDYPEDDEVIEEDEHDADVIPSKAIEEMFLFGNREEYDMLTWHYFPKNDLICDQDGEILDGDTVYQYLGTGYMNHFDEFYNDGAAYFQNDEKRVYISLETENDTYRKWYNKMYPNGHEDIVSVHTRLEKYKEAKENAN